MDKKMLELGLQREDTDRRVTEGKGKQFQVEYSSYYRRGKDVKLTDKW